MPEPIPILYVDYSQRGGGGQVHLFNILKHLDRRRWKPHVAANKGSAMVGLARSIKVPVSEVAMGKASWRHLWQAFPAFRALREVIQKNGIQLVHANGLLANKLAGPAASSLGIPSIWHKHTHIDENPPWGAEWLWKTHSLFNDRILAVSKTVGDDLQRIGVEPAKVKVLPNFVDPAPLDRAKPMSAAELKRLDIPSGVPLVGAMGARKRHKGFDLFVEAAALLAGSGGFWNKARFVLIGDASVAEPEFDKQLKALESDPRLRGRLHVLGAQPDPARWLKTFKLLVSPSRREGFGLVALEAMAVGTPVVAAYPEAAEFMRHGKEGLLAPSADSAALADAMRRAMTPEKETKRRAMAAKKRARTEFGPKAYMMALDHHYFGSLDNRP